MKINEAIALNLSFYAMKENKDIQQLHEITGLSRTTISNIKNNVARGIKFKTIEKLAEALEIEPYQLFIKRGEIL